MALRKRSISPTEIQEEYLLIQEAKKDSSRFGLIYERYYQQIFLFVFKRVADEENTADICSQVFLKAMLSLKKYKFQGVPFSAWLYRIAINEINQFFRANKSQRVISMEGQDLIDMAEEVEEDQGEENIQALLRTFQKLSPNEIQFVELRFFERLSFKEIATVYSITENNAKVRMHRLIQKMKKLMLELKGNPETSGLALPNKDTQHQ
ncbi:MAG: sigma-70 family RNA polymerase sigma factor [Bacteroidota bacterium]